MRLAAVLVLALMLLSGCATSTSCLDEGNRQGLLDDAPVNRGYYDPFGWVNKLAGVTLPLAFVVDGVFVLPIAAILDRCLCEWFPITKAVFRVMAWQEPVIWIETHEPEPIIVEAE